MTLGEKIRKARTDASLKQDELASRIGVTDRAVRFWEADEREPDFKNIAGVARETGVPIEFFVDQEEGVA